MTQTTDPDQMTTLEFLRWFAANHSRVQLGAVAASAAIGVLILGSAPLASPMPTWAKVAAAAAIVVVYLASTWVVLGTRRVQRWVIGL